MTGEIIWDDEVQWDDAAPQQVPRETPIGAMDVVKGLIHPAGRAETGLQLATGAVAAPIAGLAGMARGITGTQDDAADVVRAVQEKLTYQPRSRFGKALSGAVGSVLEIPARVGGAAGEAVTDVAGPEAGVAANVAIQSLPALLGSKGAAMHRGAAAKRFGQNAVMNATKRELVDAGGTIPPSELAQGPVAKTALQIAESVGGKAAIQQVASKRNVATFGNKIRKDIGIEGKGQISLEELDLAKEPHFAIYEEAAAVSPEAGAALKAWRQANYEAKRQNAYFRASKNPAAEDAANAASVEAKRQLGIIEGEVNKASSPVISGENGTAIDLYHGSPVGVKAFDGNERPIFLTDNPEVASGYTRQRGMWSSPGASPTVHPVHASFKNPLEIDALGKRNDNIPVPWQEWKPKVFGNLPKNSVDMTEVVKYAKAHGHDGVIVRNVVDTADITSKTKSNVYVALSPSQIVSKFSNKPAPDLVNRLRASRVELGKIGTVENALNEATGEVSASSLKQAKDRGVPLKGGMEQMAKMSKAFGNKLTQPGVIQPGVGQLAPVTAAIISALQGPKALALTGLPYAARSLLLSRAMQQVTKPPRSAPPPLSNLSQAQRAAIIAALQQQQGVTDAP